MWLEEIEQDGFAIVENVLNRSQLETAEQASRDFQVTGLRQPHLLPGLCDLANDASVRALVTTLLGADARIVRSILFDKTTENNWAVPWHQDLTIAVAERLDAPGFVGWSAKDGLHHVQAPREVLERMITVRLHLDDCGSDNGPLRVLPGTHRNGWLDSSAIGAAKQRIPEQVCIVHKGGAVLMRPLLLHASSRVEVIGRRRVLHLEFAACELPNGLRFAC